MILLIRKKKIVNIAVFFCFIFLAFYYTQFGVSLPTNTSNTTLIKKIILDAGHGGEDPGAVSDNLEVKEKDVNLKIASRISGNLKKKNLVVINTREEDRLEYSQNSKRMLHKRRDDLKRRKSIMDQNQDGIVVSIHLNKFPESKYFGAQTFYPPNSFESQKLAQTIQTTLREKIDPNNKREALLKKEPIIILKDNKNTTVIVECGFLSNTEEEKKLADENYQNLLADAITTGILKYIKLE